MNKISIVGTGSVGSTIAYTLTVMGIASDIVMIDINNEKALGEALDIRQGTPFCGACSIYAGDYRDAVNSDIVIITSGIARKPGQTRLELAQTNVTSQRKSFPKSQTMRPTQFTLLSATLLTYSLIHSTNSRKFPKTTSSVRAQFSTPQDCARVFRNITT